MCGLNFVLTTDTYAIRADDFMNDAFLANQVRGTHSSGVFQIERKDNKIITYKKAVNASNFLELRPVQGILSDTGRCRATVGHVRHATAGAVKDENAHPFLVTRADGSQLVGVHNGTLKHWRNMESAKGIDVDSAWAFEMIAEEGIGAFEYFDGAFAMIWYDSADPDSVFMVRNSERPLHFLTTDDNKTMLGCSELGMLGWLAERNRFKMSKGDKIKYLAENLLFKFSLKDIGSYTTQEIPKFNAKHIPPASTSTQLAPYSESYARSFRNNTDDMMDDDYWLPWVGRRQTGGVWTSTEIKMERVKKALKEAREANGNTTEEAEDVTIITAEDLNEGLEAAIRSSIEKWDSSKKYDSLVHEAQYLSDPNSATASRGEIKDAKDKGMFGQIVQFEPLYYDEESSELLGSYTFADHNNKPASYDVVIRGLSQGAANARFLDQKENQLIALVGYVETMLTEFPYAVGVPLTNDEIRLFETIFTANQMSVAN